MKKSLNSGELMYLKNLTVLLVEDDQSTQSLVSEYLSRIVGRLVFASNGVEGLKQFTEHTPDIVVTDINMPEMDGLEMIRHIRSASHRVLIVVLSAFNQSTMLMKAINAGINRYILKPLNSEILLNSLLDCSRHIMAENALLEKMTTDVKELRIKHQEQISSINNTHFQCELALVRTESRLAAAMKMARISLWEYDVANRLFVISDEFYALFGFPVNGKHRRTIHKTDFMALFIHPDDRERLEKTIKEGMSAEGFTQEHKLEHRIMYANGTSGHATTWFKVLKNSDGDTTTVFGLTQDITCETTDRIELEKSRERFLQIANQSREFIWEVDATGLYSYTNNMCKTLFGYEPEELIGKLYFYDLHPAEEREELRRNAMAIIRQHKPFHNFYNRIVAKTGEIFEVLTSGVPLHDTNGNLIGYRGVDRDITELQQANSKKVELENKLRVAQQLEAIGRLAGGVAHDYNNKLTVILGCAELASMQLSLTDPCRRYITEILKAAECSRDMTSQLLAFSRRQTTNQRSIDLNKIINDTKHTLRFLISEDIFIDLHLAKHLWQIFIDPLQIDQIIMNLIVNAGDAMKVGGILRIETQNCVITDNTGKEKSIPAGDYITLKISDTGTGMNADTMKSIFAPFFTTKQTGKGTGLGLATVQSIIHQNNGIVEASSTPGIGSTFTVYLPRHLQEYQPVPETKMTVNSSNARILLVEDDENVLNTISCMLLSCGYSVTAYAYPSEVLELTETDVHNFDMLLTDTIMSGMNGMELADKIRSINNRLKVIYMSGYGAEFIAKKGITLENAAFIQKPFSIEKLKQSIEACLNGN